MHPTCKKREGLTWDSKYAHKTDIFIMLKPQQMEYRDDSRHGLLYRKITQSDTQKKKEIAVDIAHTEK